RALVPHRRQVWDSTTSIAKPPYAGAFVVRPGQVGMLRLLVFPEYMGYISKRFMGLPIYSGCISWYWWQAWMLTRRTHEDPTMRRLFIDFARIGDLVQLVPGLRLLARDGELDLLARTWMRPLFRDPAWLTTVHSLTPPYQNTFNEFLRG